MAMGWDMKKKKQDNQGYVLKDFMVYGGQHKHKANELIINKMISHWD
jgi:hypothetical protein